MREADTYVTNMTVFIIKLLVQGEWCTWAETHPQTHTHPPCLDSNASCIAGAKLYISIEILQLINFTSHTGH